MKEDAAAWRRVAASGPRLGVAVGAALHGRHVLAQPFVGRAAGIALVPQHVDVDLRHGNGSSFEIRASVMPVEAIRWRGSAVIRSRIGDHAAGRDELVDDQEHPAFAVEFQQGLVHQALGAPEELTIR